MKHLLFFVALMPLSAAAQITVTNASFPVAGDTLRYQTDLTPPTLDLGSAGVADYVWDFTAVQGGAVQSTGFAAAFGGLFPNANLRTETQLNTTYYQKTNTRLNQLGTSGADLLNLGLNTTIRYQPPLPERRAPMNFFDINNFENDLSYAVPTGALADSLLGQLGGLVDSFRFRIHTKRLDVVDAWGVCQIPNGSFPVLREKRTTTTETSIDVHTFLGWTDLSVLLGGGGSGLLGNIGKDTTVAYHFFNNVEKEEIAVVTVSPTNGNIQSVRYKSIENPVSTEDLTFVILPRYTLAPNPARDVTRLQFERIPAAEFRLDIRDANGKLLRTQPFVGGPFGELTLELSGLADGLYFCRVLDAAGMVRFAEKLVVAR